MQRIANLVDLEKRCKMSIWTQKSALIQLRTSPLKLDDLAEKSEKSSVSNLSTKAAAAPAPAPAPARATADAPTQTDAEPMEVTRQTSFPILLRIVG